MLRGCVVRKMNMPEGIERSTLAVEQVQIAAGRSLTRFSAI
ncbi:MAG: hypothetical protein AAF550_13435 [Myxococcota bacterium]